jgi:hypothetical protein
MRGWMLALGLVGVLSSVAAAETWKDVPVIDTFCLSKVKAEPDKHTKACALQCAKGGYGILTSDGTYLRFDTTGNDKALAALKASKRTDHLRATVEGVKDGDSIKVRSISVE